MAIVTKEQIEAIENKKHKHELEVKKLNDLIKAMQTICEHDWESAGHDSHYDYVKCKICGKEEQA
ncbi:MAG: hypothetical protein K9I74_14615 [Bacteroidales bacterium]|nr:hypothetical protein [Bacteroidales bacterium]